MSNAAKAIGKAPAKPCHVCGFYPEHVDGKPRSLPHHRRYFSLISAVFHHWPESHGRQFADREELRAWLQMKAGWREVAAQIPIVGLPRERVKLIVEASIRAAGSYAEPVLHKDTLVIFRPKSIAFDKMRHLDFCALSDAVENVIRSETGLDPEQVLHEQERAA
jgi:hypothetical protein